MINKKTVLILGAGASIPYGFPSGVRLKAEICEDLTKVAEYVSDVSSAELIQCFKQSFTHSPQESIDAWLAKPGSDRFGEIGKYAIAKILLKYEKTRALFDNIVSSHLLSDYMPPNDPRQQPTPCWYRQLYKAIDSPLADFHKNKLSIITFNYDRSLEHFIYTSLNADNSDKGAYKEEIAEAARFLEILHVHGQLGYLPWQDKPSDPTDCEVPYDTGSRQNFEIRRAAKHIKIIHEADTSDTEFERARELLRDAERIYIIGFGYDETNLKRLGLQNLTNINPLKRIFGTTLGISRRQQHNIAVYLDEMAAKAHISYRRCDQKAYEFIRNTVLLE